MGSVAEVIDSQRKTFDHPAFPATIPAAMAEAQAVIDATDLEFQIVPLQDGGVQIEWHKGGRVIEAEFWGDGKPSLLLVPDPDDDATCQEFEAVNVERVVAEIQRFTQ